MNSLAIEVIAEALYDEHKPMLPGIVWTPWDRLPEETKGLKGKDYYRSKAESLLKQITEKGDQMNEIIMNSRGDQGIVRSMIIGFEVCETVPTSNEPAFLILRMVNNLEIFFEVASTDEEMKPLTERFRKLFEEGDE